MPTSLRSALAHRERAALADLLAEVGPDAPTLCEGWTTRDLAAHLVLREGRLDAAAGIMLRPLAGRTAHVQEQLGALPWDVLVDRLRSGPPRWSPYRLPGVDGLANSVEFFVHHEDVRRAGGAEPRTLGPQADDVLWAALAKQARLLYRRSPVPVTLLRPDGHAIVAHAGTAPGVSLQGPPGELLLHGFGRGTHAQLEQMGDEAARAALAGARLGV